MGLIFVLRTVYKLFLCKIPASTLEDTCSMLPEVTPFSTGCPEAILCIGVSRAEVANAK